jgi:hypothetical protein
VSSLRATRQAVSRVNIGRAMEAQIRSTVAGGAQPLPSDAPAATREDHTATVLAALGGFAAIATNTALMLGVRRGLPNEPWLIALALAYGVLFICCSIGIEICVADALRRTLTQLLALVALLLLPIVFFGSTLWLFAAFAGLAAWIVLARDRLAALRAQPGLVVWLGAALCCVIAIGLYGVAGYQHRELQAHFLMPEYGHLGLLHKDPLTFVSFAAEIMNGQWPGPALDGVQPIFYHFGVPLVFASLGLATNTSLFHAYMAGQQVLFVPLVVFYAGLATSTLARCAGAPARLGALAAVLGIAAVLVVPNLSWPKVYYSESSSASALLAFMMLPLVAAWLSSNDLRAPLTARAFAIAVVAVASALFKFSTAITVGALAGYLILRQRLSERSSGVVTMVALVLAMVLFVVAWPTIFGRDFALQLWKYHRFFPDVRDEGIWALSILLVAFVLQQVCRALRCDLERPRLVWRALLITFPVAVVGAWLIGNIQDIYNSRYFFNNLVLLGLPLIALSSAALVNAGSLLIERRLPVLRAGTLPAIGILVVLTTVLAMEAGRAAPARAAATISTAIDMMCRRAMPESTCRADRPRAFHAAPAELVAAIESAIGPRILAALKQSSAGDAFFVPPGNEAYWRFALGGMRSYDNLNVLPAHFGKPMLLGLPPATYGLDVKLINATLLGRYGDSARSRPVSDRELCRHAREREIGRVLVFESLEQPDPVRLLDCR